MQMQMKKDKNLREQRRNQIQDILTGSVHLEGDQAISPREQRAPRNQKQGSNLSKTIRGLEQYYMTETSQADVREIKDYSKNGAAQYRETKVYEK